MTVLEKLIQRIQALAQEYKAIRAQYAAKNNADATTIPLSSPPPPPTISASVGYKGKNLPTDVLTVRKLLNNFGFGLKETDKYGLDLQTAIYDFQIKHCQMTTADLRKTEQGKKFGWADQLIAPDGTTWRILLSEKSRGQVDESKYTAKKKEEAFDSQENPFVLPSAKGRTISISATVKGIPRTVEIWTNVKEADAIYTIEDYRRAKVVFPDGISTSTLSFDGSVSIVIKNKEGKELEVLEAEDRLSLYMNREDTLSLSVLIDKGTLFSLQSKAQAESDEQYGFQQSLAYLTLKINPVGRIADSILHNKDILTGLKYTFLERVFGVCSAVVDIATLGMGATYAKAILVGCAGIDLAAYNFKIPKETAEELKDLLEILKGFKTNALVKEALMTGFKDYIKDKTKEAALGAALGEDYGKIVLGKLKIYKAYKEQWKDPKQIIDNMSEMQNATKKILSGANLTSEKEHEKEAIRQVLAYLGVPIVPDYL